MVSHGAEVKADCIHQVNHRPSLLRILVVNGVARLVIACGDKKHVRVNSSEAVGNPGQLWKIIDCRVHIVHGKYYSLSFCRNGFAGVSVAEMFFRFLNNYCTLFQGRRCAGVSRGAAGGQKPGSDEDYDHPDDPGSLFAS